MAMYSNPEGVIAQVHKLHSTDLTQFRLFSAKRRRNTEQCCAADSRSTGKKIRNFHGILGPITTHCGEDVEVNLLKCCALQFCKV
jgi:hypothetical protein